MNERRTLSILQRVPLILAVTAGSYGLASQAQAQHVQRDGRLRHEVASAAPAPQAHLCKESALPA
jgi:hypothetical protein